MADIIYRRPPCKIKFVYKNWVLGGSLLLKKEGRYVGPGHAGVFSEGGHDWLSYHFYNAENDGLPWVDIRKLEWENDWPKASEERFDPNAYFGQ